MQAEDSSGDSQARTKDHLGNATKGGIERRLLILAVPTCLLVSPGKEYAVVSSCRDSQGHKKIDDECSYAYESQVAE
ncbi:Uncharacterised protein [Mycobacteroides abscessus]|nr:Uncharacterised protein [Mycobacteroides abscessus]SLE52649.1 Uncharacterised protein [Mycobacteroides abscessus subsp. massiliense]